MRLLPLFLLTVLGVVGAVVFLYYLLIDWAQLDAAYVNFTAIAQNPSDLTTLFAAASYQNIHRINLFAEGVWAMQSAMLAAIGLHGLCTVRR